MNILDITNYHMNPDLISRSNGDVLMIYNKGNGDMYEINDVGKDIFYLLKEQLSIPDLLTKLSESYDVEVSEIVGDVSEFLKRMLELEVIIIN